MGLSKGKIEHWKKWIENFYEDNVEKIIGLRTSSFQGEKNIRVKLDIPTRSAPPRNSLRLPLTHKRRGGVDVSNQNPLKKAKIKKTKNGRKRLHKAKNR